MTGTTLPLGLVTKVDLRRAELNPGCAVEIVLSDGQHNVVFPLRPDDQRRWAEMLVCAMPRPSASAVVERKDTGAAKS